ncbi:uncharacterized protein [Diadema setosum]|uniref:uncharacterized protein n=1 Tax=Diadema setosum TaxID=31175 RepID=UPI003B3BACC4
MAQQITVTGGILLFLVHSCVAVTFTVPNTLTANRQVTARCTESGVLESQTASWFLDGVQITEGVVTNSNQARQDKGWGYQGNARTNPPRDHIIDIEFDEGLDDNGRGIVTISCHVTDIDQPYPVLERYEIKVGSVTVSNSSSSSFTVSPSPPGCTDVTCIGMNELGSTSTVNEFCPTDPPGEDIIALQFEEQIVTSEVNLLITCHIEQRDQPTPPIDSYVISVDGETISSSSVPSAIVESRPDKCVNIMCEGRNRRGSTRSVDLYCFRDDIIDVQFNERVGENNGKIYTVVCHIDEEYQPTPGIHTFLITADNVTLSSSRSPSTAFTPRADGGTEVSCTGRNDFGSTTATKTFCPSAVEIIAEFQRQGALQRSSTTYALLVVVFFLSVIVCVAYVNRRRAFFPEDEVF